MGEVCRTWEKRTILRGDCAQRRGQASSGLASGVPPQLVPIQDRVPLLSATQQGRRTLHVFSLNLRFLSGFIQGHVAD